MGGNGQYHKLSEHKFLTQIIINPHLKIFVPFFAYSYFYLIFMYIGYLKEYGSTFFFFLIMAIGVGVYNQVLIKNREPKFCIMAFKNNQYVGLLIFLGIYGEYLL